MQIQSVGQRFTVSNANSKVSFKRNWQEHISWGANYIKEAGKTNFKLFSFPDAKAVFVEITDKFSNYTHDLRKQVIKVIATVGSAFVVNNIVANDSTSKLYRMKNQGKGVFQAEGIDARPGDRYRYVVVDKDNNINIVKDPYSKKQENINGWSSVYNPDNYQWINNDWINGKDSRRIKRKVGEPLRGLEGLIIDEVNIPTVSKEGTFEAAKRRLDIIASRGVATAIEIMPVENTFSMQWGYDGVDKFAVNPKLGGAVGLKSFVDYAHGKGLNVIMDMVPNHIGPDGDYLTKTGPYEKGSGMFGGEFNYEGPHNRFVRDWMTNAALWWVNEFKVDGLRLDMTKFCGSDFLLKQIVTEVNEHNPDVFLIAEDGRENAESVTKYEQMKPQHLDAMDYIDKQVEYIAKTGWHTTPSNIGFDSEWDFRLMHSVKNAILDSGSNLLDEVDNRIRESAHRVKYVMSHDEIGNEDGTRLISKVMVRYLNLFMHVNGNNNAEKGQTAAKVGQELAELVVSEKFLDMNDEDLLGYEKKIGLKVFIAKNDLMDAFNTAIAKQKLALGTVMTIPGPKMYFQGDESADLSYFKFFREFSNEKENRAKSSEYRSKIVAEKGYDTLLEVARKDSIVGSIIPQGVYSELPKQMESFIADLKNILSNSKTLEQGKIIETYKDNNYNVHIHRLQYGNDELLILKNFGSGFHINNYTYKGLPKDTKWKEIFNSDDKKYGGAGYLNSDLSEISQENQALSLSPNSFIILQKVN